MEISTAFFRMNQILSNNIYTLTDFLSERPYYLAHITSLKDHASKLGAYNNDVLQLSLRLLEYNLAGIRNDQEAENLIGVIEIINKKVTEQQIAKEEAAKTNIIFKWLGIGKDQQLDEKLAQENRFHKLLNIRFSVMKSAFIAWVKSDYQSSLKEALQAYSAIQKFQKDYPEEQLMIYNRLGRLYNVMGNNNEAFKYIELGKQIIADNPNIIGYPNDFYKILVKIYVDSGDFEQALKYSQINLSKLDLQEKITPSEISAHIISADILIRSTKYQEALPKLNLLLQIVEKSFPQEHPYKTNLIVYRSYVSAMLGNNAPQAIKNILTSQVAYRKRLGDKGYYKNRHVFMSHRFLGELFEKAGDNIKAEAEYSTGLSILNNMYNSKGNSVTDDLSFIYYKLSIINTKLKQYQKAVEIFKTHMQTFGSAHPRSIELIGYFSDHNVDVGM